MLESPEVSTDAEEQPARVVEQSAPSAGPSLRDPYGDGLDELPPNVPPGFLGERAFRLNVTDDEGPHGLNAGVLQEWTAETTRLALALTYLLFFPAAYAILWRSRWFSRTERIVLSAVMTAGIAYVAYRLAVG